MCGKPVIDERKLDPELKDKIYRPSPGEEYNVDEDLADPEGFGE